MGGGGHPSLQRLLCSADMIHCPIIGKKPAKRTSSCDEGKFVHGDAPEFLGAGAGVLRLKGIAGVQGRDVHVGHDGDGQIGRRVAATDHARSDRKVGRHEDVAQLLSTANDRWSDNMVLISDICKRHSPT